jgi:adenylosuccinate synthase
VLRQKLRRSIEEKNAILRDIYDAEALDVDRIVEEYVEFDQQIYSYVTDTSKYLCNALDDGANVLAEGAQGSLLDVDFGSYPYVTSSHPTAGGCCTGLGVPPTAVEQVLGIAKAYCTRVGNGPFPTELDNEAGEQLRQKGGEFGATTGRPRRCGWLDLVALRYTNMINGFNDLAITKLDILSGMEEVKVCTQYRYDGKKTRRFPSEAQTLERVDPVYRTFPGWDEDITDVRHFHELPAEAKDYLAFISEYLGTSVGMVSNGPRRGQIITDVEAPATA